MALTLRIHEQPVGESPFSYEVPCTLESFKDIYHCCLKEFKGRGRCEYIRNSQVGWRFEAPGNLVTVIIDSDMHLLRKLRRA